MIQTRLGRQSAVTGVKCVLMVMDQSTNRVLCDTVSEPMVNVPSSAWVIHYKAKKSHISTHKELFSIAM